MPSRKYVSGLDFGDRHLPDLRSKLRTFLGSEQLLHIAEGDGIWLCAPYDATEVFSPIPMFVDC
jgi:hypothetical protein